MVSTTMTMGSPIHWTRIARLPSSFQKKTNALLAGEYKLFHKVVYDRVLELVIYSFVCMGLYWFGVVDFGVMVSGIMAQITLFLGFMRTFAIDFKFIKSVRCPLNLKNTEYYVLFQRCQPLITETEEELKEIKKGNDFLNDLIDLQ